MHLSVLKNNTLAPVHVNADWLIEQRELPFLIHNLPAHSIYLALQKKDLQENLEIVEWIRGAQLQKIFDFDIWEFSSAFNTNDVSHAAIMPWLQAWLIIGKPFTAERFFELEEETIALILSKLLHIIPNGIGYVSDDIQENWETTPDKRFFIKPISDDSTDFEILTSFIDALYSTDMAHAGFLFSTAALLIRQETLEIAQKWRQARLSDQGFVEKQEALALLFSTKNVPKALSEYKILSNTNFFAEDATENTLNFLSKLEPEDGVHLIRQILGIDGIKQLTGTQNQNINFSHLYNDVDFLNDCADHIVQISEHIYKKLEYTQVSNKTNDSLLLIEKVFKNFLETDQRILSILKQKVARISNTVASTLSDHYTYQGHIIDTSLTIVRGCLNLGLELCLESKRQDNLTLKSNEQVTSAVLCVESMGIDYIFKLGFNELLHLQKSLLNYLFDHKLIEIKQLTSAKNWINSDKFVYSNEVRLAFEGLLHIIPMMHTELFLQDNQSFDELPLHLSQQFKPFEHTSELYFMQKLLTNIHHNLN